MFTHLPPVILASGSPRRKALLEQIGLRFSVIVSDIHEDFSIPLPPADFASHYASEKAGSIARKYPDSLVIGADTIVVCEGRILGKPKNETESRAMLSLLSGNKHVVMTAVALQAIKQGINTVFVEQTAVTVAPLTDAEMEHYIQQYSPFDKAGSYGIQDWFSVCVTRIEGCFYNVVGFPLAAFYHHLKTLKFA